MFAKITKKNWLFYAIKNYNVPNLDTEQEFYEDVKRFKYIKRLFRKYKTSGELKIRLILNHIIVLNNVFGNEASTTLLLFKIEREYWGMLKSFLQYLNMIREDELTNIKEHKTLLSNLEKL
tara:strand:+ start:1026 stop:1388 length:363 start_codon:yes stop_codon:yes gene_type:complete